MTNEIRHGPVTMHRAIERRLLRGIAARPGTRAPATPKRPAWAQEAPR